MIEKVRHKGLALAILAAAQFMVVLDATIVNVALPAVQKALGFTSDAQLQWVVTAYALAFGGFLLLGGRLADLFGRRKLFFAGVIIFALSSLAAGFAQDPTQMIIFRALQGLGGAFLSPAAMSLILTIFTEAKERNRALGVWGMVAAGGGAVGLLLGGVLTQYVDWRWIFFINVPIGLAVVLAARAYVPASLPRERERVDILGAVTITGSLMALVYALAQAAEKGWGAGITLASFAAAIVLMAAFIINELRIKHPLIRLSIFRQRNVTGASVIQLLMPAAMFGFFFYMSIYMQQILGYSPVKTGLANLPFTLTIMTVAGVLSSRAHKFNPKVILSVAPLLVTAGLLYFSRLPVDAHYVTDILPGIILMAAGMASVFVTATIAATNGVAHNESGLVSGLLNTGQQIGGAIGLAALTVVSTAATKDYLASHMPATARTMAEGMVTGFHHGFVLAAGFAVLSSLVAITVFKIKPFKSDDLSDDERQALQSEESMPLPGA